MEDKMYALPACASVFPLQDTGSSGTQARTFGQLTQFP